MTKRALLLLITWSSLLCADNFVLYSGGAVSGKLLTIKDNEAVYRKDRTPAEPKIIFEKRSLVNEISRLEIKLDKRPELKKQPVTALLVNGDRLGGEIIELNGSTFIMKTPFGEVTLVTNTLLALVFAENNAPLPVDKNYTTLILKNGDELKCKLKEIKDGKVLVSSDLGELELSFDRINMLVLVAAGKLDFRGKDFISVLELINGDRYSGRYLSFSGTRFRLEPMWALKARQAVYEFDQAVVDNLTFKNSGVVFLSDLEPETVKETPYFDFHLRWKKDTNIKGQPLRLNSTEYKKGISCQSRTEFTYKLDSEYSVFKSACGIENSAVTGSAGLKITADGKILFENKLKKGEAPLALDLEVKSVKELKILVDFGEAGDSGAFVSLGNPMLVKVTEGKEEAVKISEGVFRIGQVLIDKNKREVSFPAKIEARAGLIEYLAVHTEGKTYEAELSTEARPVHLQVALIMLGLQYGQNINFRNEALEPKGGKVEIFVEDGEKRLEMKDVIYDRVRKTGLEGGEFIFSGSKFAAGYFLAEQEGSLIALFKDPGAVIVYNNPTASDATGYSAYDAASRNLPAAAKPVTVIIKPK